MSRTGEMLVRGVTHNSGGGRVALACAAIVLPLACAPAHGEPHGRARIAMPFTCAVDQASGRLRVQPAPAQTFDIVDGPDSQRVVVCRRNGAGPCRTIHVHRFTLQCDRGPVPWLNVAAAALSHRPGFTAQLDEGRLVLVRQLPRTGGYAARCFERINNLTTGIRAFGPGMLDDCWRVGAQPRGAGPAAERVVLPAGYAPTTMLGVRFLAPIRQPQPPLAEAPPLQPPPAPVAQAAEPRRVHPLAFAPPAASSVPQTAGGEVLLPTAAAAAIAASPQSGSSWPFMMSLAGALAMVLAGAGVIAWRARSQPADGALAVFDGPDSEVVAQLVALAEEQRVACRLALDALPAALPLRQVIAREVQATAERLLPLQTSSPSTPEEARRMRMRMQSVARDLQRLAAIAEGARSSLGEAAAISTSLPEPRDRAEAFAVLGVSPDADERTTKKLVEALRQSWHPDQARDDADRQHREHRIKQINVAWDLITGKRAEA